MKATSPIAEQQLGESVGPLDLDSTAPSPSKGIVQPSQEKSHSESTHVLYCSVNHCQFFNKAQFQGLNLKDPICTLLMVPVGMFVKQMLVEQQNGITTAYSQGCREDGMVEIGIGFEVQLDHSCTTFQKPIML